VYVDDANLLGENKYEEKHKLDWMQVRGMV
jgi:hypothetical protein